MDLIVQGSALPGEDIAALVALTHAADAEPLTRASNEAYRLHAIAARDGVVEACAAAGYDHAFVPADRALSRVRLSRWTWTRR